MFKNGTDIKTIQEILGHSTVDVTKIYTHLYDKEVEQAMQEHPLSKFKYKDALAYAVAQIGENIMASSNEEVKFDFENIHPVDLRLLDGQVDLILRALELYVYNLDYMLNCEKSSDEERQKKIAMVKFTFEQILSAKAEQVNTKSNDGSDEIPITIGRKILETENIIKFIPDDKEIKVVQKFNKNLKKMTFENRF